MKTPANTPWVKLADYGTYPHPNGLQRLTYDNATALVRHHQSLYGRFKRYFGGVPVYIGHPDDPSFQQHSAHADSRAYAWIHKMEARADGLWIQPVWSAKGQELMDNLHYKHLSPRWKLRQSADKKTWEPTELISIGLTNMPNIQGPVIANEAPAGSGISGIAVSLGLPSASDEAAIMAAIRAAATQASAHERTLRIEALVDLAIARNKIPAASRTQWLERFAKDFETASAALEAITATAEIAANIQLISNCLAEASGYAASRAAHQSEFVRLVNERMQNTQEDFTTAWNAIKTERRSVFNKISGK